ncbi:MAG TPA: hypothetical protein VMF06_16265 [Candidatus Limnocylindria bacterium]|jgi:hypothetical protein|nr:hypothetical protein [Candidatus Limnocylindria bacterium]
MPKAQPALIRELNRQRLLLESCRNRVNLASELEKLRPTADLVDQGIELGRQAGSIVNAFKSMRESQQESTLWGKLSSMTSVGSALAKVWKVFRK